MSARRVLCPAPKCASSARLPIFHSIAALAQRREHHLRAEPARVSEPGGMSALGLASRAGAFGALPPEEVDGGEALVDHAVELERLADGVEEAERRLVDGRAATFSQRYFGVRPPRLRDRPGRLLHAGNEANVELYVNQTGLIWCSRALGAALVFAEHRYYGD